MNSWRRGRSAVKAISHRITWRGKKRFSAGHLRKCGLFMGLVFLGRQLWQSPRNLRRNLWKVSRCTNFLKAILAHPFPLTPCGFLIRIIDASCLRRCRCSAALLGYIALMREHVAANEDLRVSISGFPPISETQNADGSDRFRAILQRKS